MKMTKRQQEIVTRLESLTGNRLDARAVKRNVISIHLPDGQHIWCSKLATTLESVCSVYGIGNLEPGGAGAVAIVIN